MMDEEYSDEHIKRVGIFDDDADLSNTLPDYHPFLKQYRDDISELVTINAELTDKNAGLMEEISILKNEMDELKAAKVIEENDFKSLMFSKTKLKCEHYMLKNTIDFVRLQLTVRGFDFDSLQPFQRRAPPRTIMALEPLHPDDKRYKFLMSMWDQQRYPPSPLNTSAPPESPTRKQAAKKQKAVELPVDGIAELTMSEGMSVESGVREDDGAGDSGVCVEGINNSKENDVDIEEEGMEEEGEGKEEEEWEEEQDCVSLYEQAGLHRLQRYDVPLKQENKLLSKLNPGAKELISKFDNCLLSLGEELEEFAGRKRTGTTRIISHASLLNNAIAIIAMLRFKVIHGETIGYEELKDMLSDGCYCTKKLDDQTQTVDTQVLRNTMKKLLKRLELETHTDMGVDKLPKGFIIGQVRYTCPVTNTVIQCDEVNCLSGNENIPSWFETMNDEGKIRYNHTEHNANLQVFGDKNKRILVVEKRGNGRKWAFTNDKRKDDFILVGTSGVINHATAKVIHHLYLKDPEKRPVFCAFDSNPCGIHSICKIAELGTPVIVIMGHPDTVKEYGDSAGRILNEEELQRLRNLIEESEILDDGYLMKKSVNVEQHCSHEHPSFIKIMLDETDKAKND